MSYNGDSREQGKVYSPKRGGDSSFQLPDPPSTPLRHYFSRRPASKIRMNDLPLEESEHGIYTTFGITLVAIKLTVPLAYLYIALILLRAACLHFPETLYSPLQHHVPLAAHMIVQVRSPLWLVEIWAVVEALFYICLKLRIQWLQYQDPLEACLNSSPMLAESERRRLWERIMDSVRDDPVTFIRGWFFDAELEKIARDDVLDFMTWAMFDGRNQEHLTEEEFRELNKFLKEFEHVISQYLYGDNENSDFLEVEEETDDTVESGSSEEEVKHSDFGDVVPGTEKTFSRRSFRFREAEDKDAPTVFTTLYENIYKQTYEQYRAMVEKADFAGIRNFVAEKRQQLAEAEAHAMAVATEMYENAYFSVVDKGGVMDKKLSAISYATQMQLSEAWTSVKEMKVRLETAEFITRRGAALRQQLNGYRHSLVRLKSMSPVVPTKQMTRVLRRITQCYDAMERIESSAREAFVRATTSTGHTAARPNLWLPPQRREPRRCAKYSMDPLLGVRTYPLMFHLLLLGATEGSLRYLMHQRGFERRTVGSISYYYHAGDPSRRKREEEEEEDIPIVFCHGLGVGLISYIPFVDHLLRLKRPLFFPEITYVSCFRPWLSPRSVLAPADVTENMMAMLGRHGFARATVMGQSYGTSWVSYMCKYAPAALAAVILIDPVCFCLHLSRLTKNFVYQRPDPGVISYIVKTDIMINWTIQRAFPWTRIALFTDDIPSHIPCAVFMGDQDMLVPAQKAEQYLASKGAPVMDYDNATEEHFSKGPINVTVMRGHGHGQWTEEPAPYMVKIATAAQVLTRTAETGTTRVVESRKTK